MTSLNLITALTLNGTFRGDSVDGVAPSFPINHRSVKTLEPGTDEGESDLFFTGIIEILPLEDKLIDLTDTQNPLGLPAEFAKMRVLVVEPDQGNDYRICLHHPGMKISRVSLIGNQSGNHGNGNGNVYVLEDESATMLSIFSRISIPPGGLYATASSTGISITSTNDMDKIRIFNPDPVSTAFARVLVGGVSA